MYLSDIITIFTVVELNVKSVDNTPAISNTSHQDQNTSVATVLQTNKNTLCFIELKNEFWFWVAGWI